jgi:hypothetical protein
LGLQFLRLESGLNIAKQPFRKLPGLQ